MKKLLCFFSLTLIYLLSCTPSTTHLNALNDGQLEDGIYLVKKEFGPSNNWPTDSSGMVTKVNPGFIDFSDPASAFWVTIDTTEFVPLRLSAPPDSAHHEERNNTKLMLTLNKESADVLEKFTEKNLGKRIAMVIGGQVTTMHKVKAKIIGGKLQITRCTDNACEKLYFELKDNVK
jgi:hypothetical protein